MHADVDVTFGASCSIGEENSGISIAIEKGKIDRDDCDRLFVARRLTGRLTLKHRGEDAQKNLEGIEDPTPEVETTFDVMQYTTKKTEYTARLKMLTAELDPRELAKLAKRAGRMVIQDVESIEDDDSNDFDEDQDDDDSPKLFDVDGAIGGDADEGATLGIISLETSKLRAITGDKTVVGIGKKTAENVCVAVGGATIGHLEKAMVKNEWWHRDVKGLGVDGVDKITEALMILRKEYPVPAKD